jgi:hypothetical protein
VCGFSPTHTDDALARFVQTRVPPTPEERARFRYPEIRVTYAPDGPPPVSQRADAKFNAPGVYTTTVTHPELFTEYLLENLGPLVGEYGASKLFQASDARFNSFDSKAFAKAISYHAFAPLFNRNTWWFF